MVNPTNGPRFRGSNGKEIMHKAAKRTAAVSAAVLGIALFGSACSTTKEDAKDAMDSATSAASSIAASATSAASSVASSVLINAPEPTKIAGEDGTEYTVEGALLEKYNALDETSKGALGAPLGEQEKNEDGGVYQPFKGGVIISSDAGTFVVWGLIRDKWNELGGSQGELGYPTSDETTNADGQKQSVFQNGTLTWTEGEAEAVVVEAPAPSAEPTP